MNDIHAPAFQVKRASELSGDIIGKRISIEGSGFRVGGEVSEIRHYQGATEITLLQYPRLDPDLYQETTEVKVKSTARVVTPHEN